MRVELNVPGSVTEPRMWIKHQPVLAMALRPGSIEIGLRRSKMKRFTFDAGEMSLIPRHLEKWVRFDDLDCLYLSIAISNAALSATADGTNGEVELRKVDYLVDARLGALVEAVNAERIAGFPSGRLFLDSVEQALAVALVNGYAMRQRSVQAHRGGLGCARVRRIKEFVDAKIEEELTLCEMAQAVQLSTAHFSRMFRKSTGESPHRFVLRHRVERAKEMLRAAEARSWMSRWPAASKRSSISRERSARCMESALQNIARNFCGIEWLALGDLLPPCARRSCDLSCAQLVTTRQILATHS